MSSEITPGSFYRIMNSYTRKVVVPRTLDETVSPLCQVEPNDPNYPPLAFNWRFIEIEKGLFRLVNEQTSLCVEVKSGGTPPVAGESVHQNTCVADADTQKWYFRTSGPEGSIGRFECFLNPTLCWEPLGNSKEPYTEIVVQTVEGADEAQLWILTAIALADEGAAKGAAS